MEQDSMKFILGLGGGLSAIGGFISDVLMPIAPFGLYLSGIMLFLLALSLICYFIPSINQRLSKLKYWYKEIAFAFIVSIVVLFGSYYAGKFSGEQGFLASNFEVFAAVQEDLHIISKNIQEINVNTRETAQNTKNISHKMDNVKKETSADPRKELANRGIAWTNEKFEEVINNCDYENLELFLEGGYNLYATDDMSVPILLYPLLYETPDYQNLFLFFKKYGLDLNKKLQFTDENWRYAVVSSNSPTWRTIRDFYLVQNDFSQLSLIEAFFLRNKVFLRIFSNL